MITKEKSNVYIATIIAFSFLFGTLMICSVYYIVEGRTPRYSGNAKNGGSHKTVTVTGTAEKIFVADIMEINANFLDNTTREKFRKYIIAQGISADQIVVYDKKLKIESDLVRKMEQIYNDAEQTKIHAITYEPAKYYVRNVEEFKLILLGEGTKNALLKAETIAKNAGGTVDQLIYSEHGNYKFLNLESNLEYNTASELDVFSRRKKIKIAIDQVYSVNR